MTFRKYISFILSFLTILPLSAQNSRQTDSVVVLMNAKSLEQSEDEVGMSFRTAIDARFLHNNTYLICDTAIWNVNTKVIYAFGHVQILQDQTVLTSEKLTYLIDDNLAQFRGSVVQLLDKDGNTLRTKNLDYNTKDSIAVFERGASMKDKDGQVIESTNGTYDSRAKLFSFDRNVNMYTDSVYVKTSRLLYHTDYDFAEFFGSIDAWKGRNMLSSEEGTYDKSNERFFFTGDVHVMSDTQEAWSDSLYYDRGFDNVEMFGNIQLTDSTRNVSALGNRLEYIDSLSRVTIEKNAAVIARTDEGGQIDTVYMGADKFIYRTVFKCDIDGNVVAAASKRLDDLGQDPVMAYRKKAADEAAKAAEQAAAEAAANDPNDPAAAAARREKTAASAGSVSENAAAIDLDSLAISQDTDLGPAPAGTAGVLADSLSANLPSAPDSAAVAGSIVDSLSLEDTLSVQVDPEQARRDSLAARDTTKIGFLTALHGVKAYKSDMQMSCDSLEYCDLDSLARMFSSPIVWNEGNRQYTSDSLYVAIKNQKMDKASLMSNAFIIIQEDSICFDQIKSTEILAYFDSTTVLSRFDALGGALALFYLKENDAFATVNKVESKMLCALFSDGEIDRIFYFDSPKNDAYPVVQLPKEEKEIKGFNWQPDLRPKGKEDITPLELRKSQRLGYLARPMPEFSETEIYFPGHMASIRKMLATQDSIRRVRHMEEERRSQQEAVKEKQAADSLETLSVVDSLVTVTPAADSTVAVPSAVEHPGDSLSIVTDVQEVPDTSAAPASIKEPSAAELRAQKASEAEARRQARVDAREERWAILDARDAAKAAEKEAKAAEKRRERTYKAVLAAEKENAKDQKKLERYIKKYEKQKARRDARKSKKTT